MPKTVVGLFDRFPLAEDALSKLEEAGFAANEISIVAANGNGDYAQRTASEGAGVIAGAGAGAAIGGVAGLILGLAAMAIPGVGPVVAAGPFAAALGIAGVGATAGGLLGALAGSDIPESDAHYYAEGIRRGGALVVVSTNEAKAERAQEVLDRAGAQDIEERGAEWRAGGWRPPAEELELKHSSNPSVRQTALSGARIYHDGLEMNPRTSSFEEFELAYRKDFSTRFDATGYTYRQFAPAYRYGHTLADREPYRGKDWSSVQASAQEEWEERNPGTWEQVKEAARHAFQNR